MDFESTTLQILGCKRQTTDFWLVKYLASLLTDYGDFHVGSFLYNGTKSVLT